MGNKDDGKVNGSLKRKQYEKELGRLQVELCKLQDWVKYKGLRVIIVFECRDAAGKGCTIKAITERVSPRVFRVVATPSPSDREKTQMFMQRYFQHFPAAGEVVIFDRSWYNRAGVEYVMGFCTEQDHHRFLKLCPEVEGHIVETGIVLIKFWLEVGQEEQERRFAGVHDTVQFAGAAEHHAAGTDLGGLAFDRDFARALGDDHELLFGMLVRRMRRSSGVEAQAAGGHRFELRGGSVVIDPQVAEGLFS